MCDWLVYCDLAKLCLYHPELFHFNAFVVLYMYTQWQLITGSLVQCVIVNAIFYLMPCCDVRNAYKQFIFFFDIILCCLHFQNFDVFSEEIFLKEITGSLDAKPSFFPLRADLMQLLVKNEGHMCSLITVEFNV